MSDISWTPDQEAAILTNAEPYGGAGGSVTVSAAAGSGKTAVLTERIVRMLTRPEDPVLPEELLVVTFTRAAAAEMRVRIGRKLTDYMAAHRDRTDLEDVRLRLSDADICTIDSFCIKLVRENYREAGIRSDFGLLDPGETEILKGAALDEAIADLAENDGETYRLLNSLMPSFEDSRLQEMILELYNNTSARPDPDAWLEEILRMYTEGTGSGIWRSEIRGYIRACCDDARGLINSAIELARTDPELYDVYSDSLDEDIGIIDSVAAACGADWDDLYASVNDIKFPRFKTGPKKFRDDPVRNDIKKLRDSAKDIMTKQCVRYMPATDAEDAEDIQAMTPVIRALTELTALFSRDLRSLMDERGRYDFNTVMHLAISLLGTDFTNTPAGSGYSRTPLAERLSEQYREILIDEYQDTNAAQDILFRLLSRDEKNLFVVGDVKQSIYRFRMAMPEIFLEKLRSDRVITLGTNFRSRKGILDFTNTIFRNIMNRYVGEMEYTDAEALRFGGGYPEDGQPCAEIHILENDFENDDKLIAEARYTAGVIKKMIADGVTVGTGDSERRCTPRDFCILLRYPGGRIDLWAQTLKECGLGCSAEKTKSLFDTTEIRTLLSLLKAVNNPSDDVAVLSTLTSPIYAFSPDELAAVRLNAPDRTLYGALKAAAETGDERSALVIRDLEEFRRICAVNTLDASLRLLLNRTDLMTLSSAGADPASRQANLIAMTELSRSFAQSGRGELSAFIRFIDSAIRKGAGIAAASEVSPESDVVKIYSIHKSKGLEFPFVIIAGSTGGYNKTDSSSNMIITPVTGIGLRRTEPEKLKRYPTVAHCASALAAARSSMSEELRVLYVAMTRARERLLIIGSVEDLCKFTSGSNVWSDLTPAAVMRSGNILDLTLKGIYPETGGLRLTDTDPPDVRAVRNWDLVKIISAHAEDADEDGLAAIAEPAADPELLNLIAQKVDYVYPYVYPEGAMPKTKASQFEDARFSEKHFAESVPGFMTRNGMTAAEAGSANHLFLEKCDLAAVSAAAELDRMLKNGDISERAAKALRLDELDAFLKSGTAERIRNADRVIREKEFRAQIPLGELYPDAEDAVRGDRILLIGKADLVFIEDGQAVILDYKTDRHKTDEDFRTAYSGQLRAYSLAMAQVLDMPVKETLIFALDGTREINITERATT